MPRHIPTVVILTLAILAGHLFGSIFSLYEGIFWFDMVMHALGGAWLAAVFIAIGAARYPSFFAPLSLLLRTLRVVLLVLLAGFAWELYEYGFAVWATAEFGDLGFAQPLADTLSDLALDVLGATVVSAFLFPKEREVA